MPHISISDLRWHTPDGRTVFDRLNLGFGPQRTGLAGRNGAGKSTLLKLIAGSLRPAQGAILTEGRVAMLGQQTAPRPGETLASLFGAETALALLQRAARGEANVAQLEQCDWTLETRIEAALARVRLSVELFTPLDTLSGGQRTRAALAALLFVQPDFLLLDEPTNHLDADGRQAVAALLQGWRGGAVVASHDRALLEHMDAIVELSHDGAQSFGGGWSLWRAAKAQAASAAAQDLAEAERQFSGAGRTAQRNVERQARRDGAGRRKGQKGDMPAIAIGLRKNRAEGTSGNQARIAEDRIATAASVLEAARDRIAVVDPLTVAIPPTGLSPGRVVAAADGLCAGHGREVLRGLSFTIVGPERIALTGPNGSGKSTLLAVLAGQLQPLAGRLSVPVETALLDQELRMLRGAQTIHENFQRLHPQATENQCRAALARFMFRADAALRQVATLSGGERLRAVLACVLGVRPPALLLLDEPTNHLDLDSVEALEQGLASYDGALVVVSHEPHFLQAIATTRTIALG